MAPAICLLLLTGIQPFSLVEEDIHNLEPLSPKVTRVILVRHGECVNNLHDVMGSVCPDPENGLTSKGQEQVRKSARVLRDRIQRADMMLTSPNTRAQETAAIFAETLGYPPDEITVDKRLQEEYFGEMEGKSFHDFQESLRGVSRFTGGAPGETGDQVAERIANLFSEISQKEELQGKTVLCFTHWFTVAGALRASGVPVECLKDRKVSNGECVSFLLSSN